MAVPQGAQRLLGETLEAATHTSLGISGAGELGVRTGFWRKGRWAGVWRMNEEGGRGQVGSVTRAWRGSGRAGTRPEPRGCSSDDAGERQAGLRAVQGTRFRCSKPRPVPATHLQLLVDEDGVSGRPWAGR